MYGLISVILIFSPIPVFCGDGPIVNTPLGRILGTIQKSRKGIDFYSFRGIRYADPPVGDLRFKVSIVPFKFLRDMLFYINPLHDFSHQYQQNRGMTYTTQQQMAQFVTSLTWNHYLKIAFDSMFTLDMYGLIF